MRDIKFRAWATRGKEMIDLKAITPLALSDGILRQGDGLFIPFREDIILMQYTGLKDKNGVEIYEGDVVSFPELYETPEYTSTNYITAKVIFIHGAFHIQQREEAITVDTYNMAHEMQSYDDDFTVIGNIYQNPSLINALNQQGETNNG